MPLALLAGVAAHAVVGEHGTNASFPIVRTTLGDVVGREESGVNVWRGIPFAAPPTGDNRYRAPQPATPWQGVRPAFLTGAMCKQEVVLGNEDCLFLHVAAPTTCTPASPCPIMFYLFGGGFALGSDEEFGMYEPIELARSQGVVVVASNYRVSALGFLATPELLRESGTAGNWAMLDQRAALQWTQQNLRAFGGDTGAVTLFGESAGAFSVCWHLAAPASRSLFHRAILQSGLCANPAFFQPLEDALTYGSARAKRAGCDAAKLGSDAAVLRCLRAVPPAALLEPEHADHAPRLAAKLDELQNAGHATGGHTHSDEPRPARSQSLSPPFGPLFDWGPVVDGSAVGLPLPPLAMIQSGRGAGVPIMLGNNQDEGSLFVLSFPILVPGTSLPPAAGDLRKVLLKVFGGGWANSSVAHAETIASAVTAEYPSADYSSEFWRNAAVLRDFIFACPERRLARAVDGHGASVWRYRFAPSYCTHPGLSDASWLDLQLLHCYHGSELYAVWGHAFPALPIVRELTPPMRAVSKQVQDYWGAFARHADPSPGGREITGSPAWPRFRSSSGGAAELTMHISEVSASEPDTLSAKCDFWDKLCGETDCFA